MKRFKIGLLVLSLGISSANANNCVGFIDVSDTDTICEDLTFAKESLWVGGYSDGSFKPNKKVNRAEFTKIVMNAIRKQSLAGQNCFYDSHKNEYEIKSNEWYSGYVCEAKKMDIIKGRKDGLFHPNDNVNYVEALKIVLKALGYQSQEWLGNNWYDTYLTEANAMNLPIYPNEHLVTRGEMITLMRKVYSNHTKRALAEKKWKNTCHAKNFNFYKLGKIPSCKEKWMMQLFYEVGIPTLNTQTTQVNYAMGNIEDTHDIALNTFKTISLATGIFGSVATLKIQEISKKFLIC